MTGSDDPFRYHPELRDRIRPSADSFFRNLDPDELRQRLLELGAPPDWGRTDAEREATRRAALRSHQGEDVWLFGYGSLMWDPAIDYAEVRYARVPGYARRFCLWESIGARGTPEAPGLIAALARGDHCDGLVFRIPGPLVDRETDRVWRREMIGHAYLAEWVPFEAGDLNGRALTFVANPEAENIRLDLTHDERVKMLATGAGILGTSLEYISNLKAHLDTLGLEDMHVTALLRDAQARAAAANSE